MQRQIPAGHHCLLGLGLANRANVSMGYAELQLESIRVLSPSERGARTMSRRVVHNTVVSVTQRWEQHVYLARLQHLHSFLMKAVLRGRWAKHRDCLIYDVQGLFRCLKWRILLGVLHQILRNIYSLTLLTKGTSPLLQRERSTLKALPKMTDCLRSRTLCSDQACHQ